MIAIWAILGLYLASGLYLAWHTWRAPVTEPTPREAELIRDAFDDELLELYVARWKQEQR